MELLDGSTFFDMRMTTYAFRAFEDMKKRRELCDVTLKVQSGCFHAHRVVLAATIPYFRLMFNSRMLEASQSEITLLDVDPTAVELIINFAYSGKICLTTENAFSLLVASDYFQLNNVKQYCGEFLSLHLNSSNVARIHDLALCINHAGLIESTDRYIQDNFQKFSKTSEFTKLPSSLLQKFISKDGLNITGENIIFEAIMNWTKALPCERLELLPKLLSEVRMPYLSRHYLNTFVESEELVEKCYQSRFIISAAKEYISSPRVNSVFLPFRTLPREYSIMKHGIYVILPSSLSDYDYSLMHYDPDNRKWIFFHSLKILDGTIRQIVFVKENISIFMEDHRYHRFNLRSKKWEKGLRQKSDCKFCRAAIVSHHNKIYCFGGISGSPEYIYCYSTEQKSWTFIGKMASPRSFAAAAGLGGSIYVTGGLDSLTVLRSVEKHCILTGDVTELSPMLSRRRSHCCASVNSKIYVCGGYCDGALNTAEIYDPQIDEWTFIPVMMKATFNCSLVSYQGKLYLFGSMLHAESTDIQIYDIEKNEWTSDKAPTNVASAAIVPGS